jgi:hypothetical protein
MNKLLFFIFICCFVLSFVPVSANAQTSPNAPNSVNPQVSAQIQKLKNQIEKIGRGNDITVILLDGKHHYGSILSIEDELVLINDVDRNQAVEINYRTIRKVRKNYGVNRDLNGNRIAPRKNFIGLVLGSAAIIIPVIILAASKD